MSKPEKGQSVLFGDIVALQVRVYLLFGFEPVKFIAAESTATLLRLEIGGFGNHFITITLVTHVPATRLCGVPDTMR